MSFKTLLWKEYRQSRQLLLACGILLSFPYLVVVVIWLVGVVRYGQPLEGGWADSIAISSTVSLFISAILCPFVAAQIMAGERDDRSAEFTGYLPIPRNSALSAKTVFALGIVVFAHVSNGFVGYLCHAVDGTRANSYAAEVTTMLAPPLIAAVLTFGVAWLVSTLVGRPSVGAASGLASVFVLGLILMFVEEALRPDGVSGSVRLGRTFAWLFVCVGIACFLAGTVCYLRRVEP